MEVGAGGGKGVRGRHFPDPGGVLISHQVAGKRGLETLVKALLRPLYYTGALSAVSWRLLVVAASWVLGFTRALCDFWSDAMLKIPVSPKPSAVWSQTVLF